MTRGFKVTEIHVIIFIIWSMSELIQFSSSLSYVWLFVTPWTAACQASMSITNSWSSLKPMSIESVMASSHLILCHPCLLLPSIFPSSRFFFQIIQFFTSGGQSIGVPVSAWVLPMNIQDWFPLGFPWSSRDSQESSPTSHFKSINSLLLSFFVNSPTLISIHGYWKNHSLD